MNSSVLAVAFGEHIMKFVIEKNDMFWVPARSIEMILRMNPSNSELIPHVGTAVCNVIGKVQSDITSCKKELEEMGSADTREFARYALVAARCYFKRGYSPVGFLCYCAIVGGVAMEFYKTGKSDIPNCAAEVIGIVLTAHILTRKFAEKGGYETLMETCKQFNEVIERQNTGNAAQDNFVEQVN